MYSMYPSVCGCTVCILVCVDVQSVSLCVWMYSLYPCVYGWTVYQCVCGCTSCIPVCGCTFCGPVCVCVHSVAIDRCTGRIKKHVREIGFLFVRKIGFMYVWKLGRLALQMYRSKMLLEYSEFCALLWWAHKKRESCSFMKETNASGTDWSVIIAIVIRAHFIVGQCVFWRVNCDVLFSQVIGRPRIKRVTHKDLQFLMEQDHHLCKSPLLYRTFLKWEQLCLANLTPAWTDTQLLWSLQENHGAGLQCDFAVRFF